MEIIIDGFDFGNFEPERYWSLPKSKNPKIEIPNLVFGLDYIAARKIDGNWMCIIKDLNGELYARPRNKNVQGEYPNKIDWIPHIKSALSNIPNGTVLVGEIYIPKHEHSKDCTRILGCLKDKALKRQEDEDWKMHFYIFDILAINEHSIMDKGLEARLEYLHDLWLDEYIKSSYIEEAIYFEGQELWDYIGEVLAAGGEGVVLQKRNSPYTPGKRTAWKTCKVKKEIGTELDLFFTGRYKPSTREYKGMKGIKDWQYWQHKRTGEKMFGYYFDDYNAGATIEPISKGYYNGWAGSIELAAVDSEGKIVPVAWISNITEDVREKVTTGEMDKQVVKVSCMELDSSVNPPSLRHAKITEYREDKEWTDCGIEQLY